MRVLAKAYGNRPLDRIAVKFEKKVVYIAAPSVADAMQPGELAGVGFPHDHVFAFDSGLFESLQGAWSTGDGALLSALWAQARPVECTERIAA